MPLNASCMEMNIAKYDTLTEFVGMESLITVINTANDNKIEVHNVSFSPHDGGSRNAKQFRNVNTKMVSQR
jgi:hypothetical protein